MAGIVAASGTFKLGSRTINRLGFGAMQITGKGVWGPPRDHDEAIRVLKRALKLGVNLIDTADSYGPEVSELLIAEALYPYPDDLVIATKGGLLRPGPSRWEACGRPDHLRAACDHSLSRLKLDRIHVYQLHSPDRDVPFEDSVGTLADLQREGKIEHVGLSNVTVEQLARAQEIVPIVSVQNLYNLVQRYSEDVLEVCEKQDIAFLPWYPLETGSLTKSGGPLGKAAKQLNATPAQVALAWLLKRSPVMLPIPGTSSVAHLEENCAAAELQLDDATFEQLARAA